MTGWLVNNADEARVPLENSEWHRHIFHRYNLLRCNNLRQGFCAACVR